MVLPEIGLPWAGHPSPGITIDLTSVKLNNVKFLTCISFNNNDVATDNLLGIDITDPTGDHTIRMVDNKDIIAVSDEEVLDETFGRPL